MPPKKTVRFANQLGLPLEHVYELPPISPRPRSSWTIVKNKIAAAPTANAIRIIYNNYKRSHPHDEGGAARIMFAYIKRRQREMNAEMNARRALNRALERTFKMPRM